MNYTSNYQDGLLTIFLCGSIDSNNANECEGAINEIISQYKVQDLILDMDSIVYISSAGLRIILRLMKRFAKLQIINLSSEVYDIFDMTGFTNMVDCKKAYRKYDVSNCKIIGEGAKGVVYRYNDDTIIKVYKDKNALEKIEKERALAKKAFILGVPTAISYDVAKVGDSYATVFELLDCKNMAEVMLAEPDKFEYYAKEYAHLLRTINDTETNDKDIPRAKNILYGWLDLAKNALGSDLYPKMKELVDGIKDNNNLVHGDYHTKNIMIMNNEMLLIDMDTLSVGNRITELAIVAFNFVTMNEFDNENSYKFIGINKEDAERFYDIFLNTYFDGKSKEEIEEINKKMRLLSYLRVISHTAKRNPDSEQITMAKQKIKDAIGDIKDLIIE